MKEDKILEAYEKMINDNTQKISEGKVKNFLNKMKDDFLVNLFVSAVNLGGKFDTKDWEGLVDDDALVNFETRMKKAGIGDPFLGKLMKRMKLKYKK